MDHVSNVYWGVIMNILEKSISIALEAHAGQKDKAGNPYILHPLHIMSQLNNDFERSIGVLHDVIEDSEHTSGSLFDLGISRDILKVLHYLTHTKEISYYDYIRILSTDKTAKKIKILDLKHNIDITRLLTVSDIDLERARKYHGALLMLTG